MVAIVENLGWKNEKLAKAVNWNRGWNRIYKRHKKKKEWMQTAKVMAM